MVPSTYLMNEDSFYLFTLFYDRIILSRLPLQRTNTAISTSMLISINMLGSVGNSFIIPLLSAKYGSWLIPKPVAVVSWQNTMTGQAWITCLDPSLEQRDPMFLCLHWLYVCVHLREHNNIKGIIRFTVEFLPFQMECSSL